MRVVKYPDFNKERSKAVLFDGKRRLNVPLYVVFSKDEFVVYEIDVNQRFNGKYYYPTDDELILIGNLSDFQNWIYEEFIRHAPLCRWLRKLWR